jgi:hypothetical protein
MKSFFQQFVFLILPLTAVCGDIAVLVDVSGTMKRYGNWQPSAVALLEATLEGRDPPMQDWQSSGGLAGFSQFRLQPGERLHLVRFGSVQSAAFPFFEQPQVLDRAGLLRGAFPVDGSAYTQARTNKPLAQAVGATLSASGNEARLIIISDFLVDSDLEPSQLEFVNNFESRANLQAPMILSWRTEPRVQIKMMQVTLAGASQPGPPVPPSTKASIRLMPMRILDGSPKRAQFQWRVESDVKPRSYEVILRDTASRAVEWNPKNIMGTSAVWSDPKSGRKSWQVRAVMEDGQEVISSPAPAEIPGSKLAPILFTLLALAAAGGGAYYYAGRQRQKVKSAAA